MTQEELVKKHLSDRRWRLKSGRLYKIKDKYGNVVEFTPNTYQSKLIDDLHYKNLILKARQLGFSTMIQILMLDQAIFYNNISCGIIADTEKNAKQIFDNKIKFAYENLPDWLIQSRKLVIDNSNTLGFSNGSSIYVGVSFRGGTLQFLHVSEYGKICAKFPDRAREINTGALEAVASGCYTFIESTAEGKAGDFYDKTMSAMKLSKMGKNLNEHEYKFFFFPRRDAKEYVLDDKEMVISKETKEYFIKLENESNIVCSEQQRKRRQAKHEEKKDDMFREYPSTPEEAFTVATEGSYYAKRINEVYKSSRLCSIPYEKYLPVHTARDLGGTGGGDNMDIWFFQVHGKEIRLIDWFTGVGYSIQDIHHEVLKEKGYSYGTMFMPHDAKVQSMNDHKTREDQLKELGYETEVLDRTLIADRHAFTRDHFKYCWFDKQNCERGLDMLREYKRKRNDSVGSFVDDAEKNEARHTGDSFGYTIQSVVKLWDKSKSSSLQPYTVSRY